MADERNMSLVEAASRLGISPYTLRSWAKYGGRITYIKAGRRLLFRAADIEAFERRNLVEARAGR
jgi:excisionase family DNA binding protein